jgi:hypothetical protein
MHKLIASLIVSASALAVAQAQAPISSVNAAGYIKVTVQANKFDGGQQSLDDVIGTALPDSSVVYVWNSANQTFDLSNYIDGLGWFPNLNLRRGEGFFVNAAPGAASYDLFLYGEVPGATSAQTTSLNVGVGFSSIGFPYPVATTLNTSGLNDVTVDGDTVFMWNSVNQNYNLYNRIDAPGFEWAGDENTAITPGSAIFLKKTTASPAAFVSQVPYSWPNN